MMDRLKPLFLVLALQLSWVMAAGVQGRDSDAMDFTKDSLETVQKNVAEGKAVLVDVRGLIEWNSGHIRKAILVPWRDLQSKQLEQQLVEKLPKDKIIYTYCAVGYRSSRAGKILAKYKIDVRPLKPGYEELAKFGFATENQ